MLLCARNICVTDFLMKREDFVHAAVVSAKVKYSLVSVFIVRMNRYFEYIVH